MSMEGFSFEVEKQLGKARLAKLETPHGTVTTPFFQFVATQAAIKGQVLSEDLQTLGIQVVLANTYHLHVRPGSDTIAEAGGLHDFMQWTGPITTDSGGYQVFSLGQHLKLDEDGVTFRSVIDGDTHRLTPETTIQIETHLGADIIMPLDIATAFDASKEEVAAAVAQTTEWAQRCAIEHKNLAASRKNPQALYGIVQGGLFPDLREESAAALQEIGFFGYSIGGELRDATATRMDEGVKMTIQHLPKDAPRYLMGAGSPADIVRAVRNGVDQFDTVLPIRNARHGKIYTQLNTEEVRKCLRDPEREVTEENLYTAIDIRKARFARDWTPLVENHPVLQQPYTHGYVHHLLRAEPPAGHRLAVLVNIDFYAHLMRTIRQVISEEGT